MSHSRRLVVVMAALAALVAVPSTASARSSTAAASVQAHVVKAKKAVKRMNRAAKTGDSAGVVRQLRTARSQTATASRKARAMAAGPDSVAAAKALTLTGMSYEQLLASITQLVDQVPGQPQVLLAKAIKPSLESEAQVVGTLASLLDDVPASVQPVLASIVTGLAVGDADEVTNMDAALRSGELPVNVSAIVTQALGMATHSMDTAFSAIKPIVPMLPAPVQGPMSGILNMVTGVVGTIVPTMLGTVTGLIDTILGSLPFVGSGSGAGAGAGSGAGAGGGAAGSFGGMLGGLTGGGQSALPGNTGNMLSDLLGSLFGGGATAGAGGIGGIISSIMGLITSLLGGVFGGGLASGCRRLIDTSRAAAGRSHRLRPATCDNGFARQPPRGIQPPLGIRCSKGCTLSSNPRRTPRTSASAVLPAVGLEVALRPNGARTRSIDASSGRSVRWSMLAASRAPCCVPPAASACASAITRRTLSVRSASSAFASSSGVGTDDAEAGAVAAGLRGLGLGWGLGSGVGFTAAGASGTERRGARGAGLPVCARTFAEERLLERAARVVVARVVARGRRCWLVAGSRAVAGREGGAVASVRRLRLGCRAVGRRGALDLDCGCPCASDGSHHRKALDRRREAAPREAAAAAADTPPPATSALPPAPTPPPAALSTAAPEIHGANACRSARRASIERWKLAHASHDRRCARIARPRRLRRSPSEIERRTLAHAVARPSTASCSALRASQTARRAASLDRPRARPISS